MKALWKLGVVALLAASGGLLWLNWRHDEPRRNCIHALQNLCQALSSNDSRSLLQSVILPQAIVSRTPGEQAEFLIKALHDEISPEGLAQLRKHAKFGPLKEIFPDEAERWAKMAGVSAEDCVAFRLDQPGLRTEVVLLRPSITDTRPSPLRIVRCNNVRLVAANN